MDSSGRLGVPLNQAASQTMALIQPKPLLRKKVEQTCLSCHALGGMGPFIPFETPEKLGPWLSKIEERTQNVNAPMPPYGLLSPNDRDELLKSLKKTN